MTHLELGRSMGDFRKLEVWQKAHLLTVAVYRATGAYPAEEMYGLTSQTRRAAASVPMNLAEGCGRNSDGELARFARISLGSANELDYQFALAKDLGYLAPDLFEMLVNKNASVRRMLSRLAAAAAA